MDKAKAFETSGDLDLAFHHYERAHIISQRWFLLHWQVHWAMLRIGRTQNDRQEVRGQIKRLAAVPFGWLSGWIPKGNTGGANVSPIIIMDMPPDIKLAMEGFSVWTDVTLRIIVIGVIGASVLVLT
jgi:hypothetical protein